MSNRDDQARYRKLLDKFDLTHVEAGQLFRADERTSRRWANGYRSVQNGVAILVELLLGGKITLRDLERIKRRSR